MIQRGPFVKGKPRKRNRNGTWRKKRSDAGKKRGENMGNNVRDEQFKGFAENLWDEIIQAGVDGIYGEDPDNYCKKLIARRAYDLAKHTMSHVGQGMAAENEGGSKYLEENMRYIPDMTELPKEQE